MSEDARTIQTSIYTSIETLKALEVTVVKYDVSRDTWYISYKLAKPKRSGYNTVTVGTVKGKTFEAAMNELRKSLAKDLEEKVRKRQADAEAAMRKAEKLRAQAEQLRAQASIFLSSGSEEEFVAVDVETASISEFFEVGEDPALDDAIADSLM